MLKITQCPFLPPGDIIPLEPLTRGDLAA